MSAGSRVLARAAAVIAGLTAAASLSFVPQASAVTVHRPLNDTRPVGSAPVSVDFPIEYFGVVADLASRTDHLSDRGPAPFGEARFLVRGQWTAWQALEQDGAQAPGQFTGALLSVDRADAYQVRGLPAGATNWRAAAINTSDGPTVVVGHRRSDTATAASGCRSRADWGADESINGDSPSFSPVQALTVHHTAGSNDPAQDYAATVRAIYSYHVKTRGWSDIGYQYLVGGDGIVYEGRWAGHTSTSCLYDGGDGSDFAHKTGTDNVVTGAHVANWNTGNVGIALMGCYEPGSTTCTGDTQPPAASVDALESELARLATRHGLDPEGTVHYVSPSSGATKDVKTISGHRDWGSTECPGGNLYAQLPAVRSGVAERMQAGTPTGPSTVSFEQASRKVGEDAGVVQLVVARSGDTTQPASVDFARVSGTATPDTDFTLVPGTLVFAAGETAKTIAITVADDPTPEARETITVALSNPSAETALGPQASTTVTVTASDQRPDGQISTATTSGYIGNDVYNETGYRQTKTVSARRTRTRTFYVRVHNDGNVRNTVVVRGTAPRSGSRVRYHVGSTNITSAMRSAEGWRARLAPGAYTLVKVRIEVLRSASFGTRKPAKVSATWTGDGTRADLVKAVVEVVR